MQPSTALGPILRRFLTRLSRHVSVEADQLKTLKNIPQDRIVVYVMPSASLLDHLLMKMVAIQQDLPHASYANDVPFLWFQNFRVALRRVPRKIQSWFKPAAFRARDESREIVDILSRGEPITLFLKRPGLFARSVRWNVLVWEELIRAERRGRFRLTLVPVNLFWGRKANRIGRSFIEILLGDAASPSYLLKIYHLIRYWRDITLRIGEPIELSRFLHEVKGERDEDLAKKLRRMLSSYLFRDRKLLTGPPIRDRDRIIRVLLKDPDLRELVAGVARREKKTEEQIWQRARGILLEMIANYKPTYFDICYQIFIRAWGRLFGALEVDEQGFQRMKAIALDHPVILIPSHKSHMDYLLLSAIFYEHGMMPPHIAAGVNLSFFPMGYIFRSTGAYFIRRKISGDLLYARLLALYVRWLLRTGYSQEFFIEGGRSRTGKLVSPKHGLLSMQVEAYLSGASRDLYVVPISVTYERVPEEGSYREELSGREKQRENFWALLRSRNLLSRFYGAVYVRFGAPISLRSYFEVDEIPKMPVKERKGRIVQLAYEVVREIASQTVVTNTAIVSSALLAHPQRGVVLSVLSDRAKALSDYLKTKNAPLSPAVADIDNHLLRTLDFFTTNRWIQPVSTEEADPLYIIREDKRITLDYYKNTVLHFFLPAAIAASAKNDSEADLLRHIFAHEFHLKEATEMDELWREGRAWLEASSPIHRKLFSGLIGNYLEAYLLAAQMALKERLTTFPSREVTRNSLTFGNRLFATGEITRREAISFASVQSAQTYLHTKGLLANHGELEKWAESLKAILAN